MRTMRLCSVDGCGKKYLAKGFCCMHYERMKAHGTIDRLIPTDQFFWKRVKKTDSCWLWTGQKSVLGYGMISRGEGKKHLYAHRYSYELHKEEIPKRMFVCHTCDNPSCVNPEHLFLGTQKDNMRDMSYKNRANNQHKPQLKIDDCINIKRMFQDGLFNQTELARLYNVKQSTIWQKINREYQTLETH